MPATKIFSVIVSLINTTRTGVPNAWFWHTLSCLVGRDCLAGGEVGGVEGCLVGVAAAFADFYYLVVAVGQGHFGVVRIDEGEEYDALAVGVEGTPFLCLDVEVEADFAAVVLADDVVAFAVAFDEVFAVLSFDDFGAFGYGVVAAPEFDAVEHEDVGEA